MRVAHLEMLIKVHNHQLPLDKMIQVQGIDFNLLLAGGPPGLVKLMYKY